MRTYVYQNEETSAFPFGVAFYMFRTGAHKTAIQYLAQFNNDKIKRFSELYNEYFEKHRQSLPSNEIKAFYTRCKIATDEFADMYKDAMICLMIGT